MSNKRTTLPAELRRRVLVEAGHRCAIPACRHIEVDIHHIVPWEQCHEHKYDNLIALCPNCHRRATQGDIDRKSLRIYKANLRFAHDKFSQLELDILFTLARQPATAYVAWPAYMSLLILRILDAGFVALLPLKGAAAFYGPIKMTPDKLQITDAGRSFIASLATKFDEV